MKKLLPLTIVAIGLLFTSCKKDYTCTCIENIPGYPQITTITDLPKMTKKSAISACGSQQAVTPNGASNYLTLAGYSYACHL